MTESRESFSFVTEAGRGAWSSRTLNTEEGGRLYQKKTFPTTFAHKYQGSVFMFTHRCSEKIL